MRRFGIQCSLMAFALLLWAVILNAYILAQLIRSVPKNKSTLIVGDSHSTGFAGDSIFNLSYPGEPLPLQIGKALTCLEHGEFSYVICVVGPQTASSEPARFMNNERNWLTGNTKTTCIPTAYQPQILNLLTPKTIVHITLNLLNWSKSTSSLEGPHQPHGTETDLSESRTMKRLTQHDVLRPTWYCDQSRFSEGLHLLSTACLSSKARLTLIETPTHISYRRQVHRKGYDTFKTDLRTFSTEWSHIKYVDLSDAEYSDEEFSDADHLNQMGFARFMREEFHKLSY